jgi:hypothetical protein
MVGYFDDQSQIILSKHWISKFPAKIVNSKNSLPVNPTSQAKKNHSILASISELKLK